MVRVINEDEIQIRHICSNWTAQDVENLGVILNLSTEESSLDDIERKFKWFYYSKIRAHGKVVAKSVWAKFTKKTVNTDIEGQFPMPSYKELIGGLLNKMKINYGDERLKEMEQFLCDAVIAEALLKMTPEQRRRAFTETVALDEIDENLSKSDNTLSQTVKGIGGVSLLNAAGFSLYTSATAALSFASGMAGITLPFAVYTSMTSFISIIIGPVGWAAFGGWVAWKGTSADWDKLRLALLYVISVQSKKSKDFY
jgi:uncharacterized protein YaaW (UPF0174 family)